ncbi:F-actin-uncapping protein LRRC16A-like isoform X3 [Brienomyrus brachyistius]|uniref:F-actin-uncapping protein LRRC16A-like isoform X3 n=1 Tax=Brienomyrus brachyistius TaxID=42636 RepID=UPI0020B35A3B|nr:F-actin-uncapping protein LRRC16A-like isoform X3 [Brienomyrus brachyistius]
MSEEASDIPKDLLESMKDAVGRRVKLTLKKKVKLEIKGDKVENRVLALSAHRTYLLSARIPAKVEQSFNYLEIQGIACNKPAQLALEHDRGSMSMKLPSPEDVNDVVAHIGHSLQRICPGLPPLKMMKKVLMEPPERISNLQALWEKQTVVDPGPCGGFSQTYKCICDFLGQPYREEVQWDVDTIYLTQDTRELNLQDFSHLENRDLVAIIAVLEYNQWFIKLSTKDYKLPSDVCDQILRVVSRSSRLEELVLDNAGLKTDFAQKLASALSQNTASALHTINLANNPLEDRGIASLGAQFAKLRKGLKHLNFSKTSLSPKGVNCLAQSLSANQSIPCSLTHLDLSGNILRGDDLGNLYTFLGQPNSLSVLDLSNTDCALDLVCPALLRGSAQHLSVLNMSKSVFAHRKGKDIPPTFKQFFSSVLSLSSISVSGTKLPPDALKALLLGLASNPSLRDVSLDLSCCELRSAGSQVLEGCIAEIPNVSSLDVSDNGLDSDLTTLLVWLSKNRSIRHLSLGKNFNNIKSKNLAPILDTLVHMIQDEESPLTSLSLADSKLKGDLSIVLNALGSNTSLTKVDISGNAMGDMGAKMLAKALQINSKLRTVIWDKNNVSPQGLQDVAAALEKNFTIRFMPIPIIDASQALKASPEKTEDALLKIESYLFRNHKTRKYQQEQAYRLQQGIVTTTTQQMIDRICVKVQDHLNSLRYTETDTILEDMKMAENLMKDARNSKTLLPNLYHLGASSRSEISGTSANPIQEKLESMAGEVAQVMDEQLQNLLESMVGAAEGLCPHVMKRPDLRQELIVAGVGKAVVPRSFVRDTLLEESGVDIINKISEVKLGLASFLSDRIVDEILEALSSSQRSLADHLARKGQPLVHQESLELDVSEERTPKRAASGLAEVERLEDPEACMMTPKSKRKSIHSRMLRPVSRAFEMEFDLDKALEDVPIHVEDPPLSTKAEKKSSVAMGELPSEEGKKLQHYTKLRPKRSKKVRSSKVPISTAQPQEGEQNGLMGRVDEGVDEFFSKKVTKLGTKKPPLKSSESQDGEKRRDSRKGGFLNLIKSRSSKSDKGQAAAAPTTVTTATTTPATVTPVTVTPANSTSASAGVEQPPSPKSSQLRNPVPDPTKSKETRGPATDYSSSSDELKTPDSVDEPSEGDGKGSPQGSRRYGVQVMGSGLLAEMKAKQERRAAGAQKAPDVSSSPDRPDGSGPAAVRGNSSRAESRTAGALKGEGDVNSPEKNPRSEVKPEAAPKPRGSASNPPTASPKPLPQGPKPAVAARPAIPQKPRTSNSRATDESSESPGGNASPKGILIPHPIRKSSDKEREGQGGGPLSGNKGSAEEVDHAGDGSVFDFYQEPDKPVAAVRVRPAHQYSASTAEEVGEQEHGKSRPEPARTASATDSSQHQSLNRQGCEDSGYKGKEKLPSKDRGQAGKSQDASEDPDKDFIFI